MTDQSDNLDKMVADALHGSWVHRFLPQRLWPFAQLARWERPIGWQLLMWPCLWSVLLALLHRMEIFQIFRIGQEALEIDSGPIVSYAQPLINYLLPMLAFFVIGAFLMRGAGCTFNDLADVDIDEKVARTKSRPLPSGRVTRKAAYAFLALQLLLGLVILLQFNGFSIGLGIASLVLVAIYPFMKRITWWPQLFLGLAFSWGTLMGWTAVLGRMSFEPIILYIGCIAWVIGYDTIYAHQDREDDALVGVKSTARLFGENSKSIIAALYAFAMAMFALAFWLAMPVLEWRFIPAYAGLAIAGLHMVWQIKVLDIDNGEQCLALFKSNSTFGLIIFTGLLLSVLLNTKQFAYLVS